MSIYKLSHLFRIVIICVHIILCQSPPIFNTSNEKNNESEILVMNIVVWCVKRIKCSLHICVLFTFNILRVCASVFRNILIGRPNSNVIAEKWSDLQYNFYTPSMCFLLRFAKFKIEQYIVSLLAWSMVQAIIIIIIISGKSVNKRKTNAANLYGNL